MFDTLILTFAQEMDISESGYGGKVARLFHYFP
jgi:hypothetical protein